MSGFEADRESVALLRASARALIDETISEPCWGLAHGLAELIERLVSSSGLPAACFGKGAHLSAEMATTLGERLPECCPACGEWAGQHESWCSQGHEGQAEHVQLPDEVATSEQPLHYFGCCPVCHKEGYSVCVGPDNWFVCTEHMIAWCVGSGLFSIWRELTQEQHETNRALIERCERIEPPTCTCSSERSPFESEQPEWLTIGPAEAATSELLDWLDLSGLPPAPPLEPPACKPTNWRFDAPDGGEQIPF